MSVLRTRRGALSAVLAASYLLACTDATTSTGAIDQVTGPSLRGQSSAEATALTAPVFGIDAGFHDKILAAVATSGVFRVAGDEAARILELPGVNDVAEIGFGHYYALTGGSEDPNQILPTSRKLFRVSHGRLRMIADFEAFEDAEDPDRIWRPDNPEKLSNPFDLAVLGAQGVLVADAAANDLLIVRPRGRLDWVAVLRPRSDGGPQPVPTSVAVGPDGDYYVGELTGWPGPENQSRIWRIERGSRRVECPSAHCTLFADGFTSIMDLAFGRDGRLYVAEFDEAGWFQVELNGFSATERGGTVSACHLRRHSCSVVEAGLPLPTALTIDRSGVLWIAEHPAMLFAGARVRPLCSTKPSWRSHSNGSSLRRC